MLVAGYSGIGKSALVHEVHKPIVRRRGYFISGKFDQYNRNIPYASLDPGVPGAGAPAPHRVAPTARGVARASSSRRSARTPQVIIDVIPEVELIIGPQPPVADAAARPRRRTASTSVFESFFRAFAGAEHPLVVFLDDLQWADPPSLRAASSGS